MPDDVHARPGSRTPVDDALHGRLLDGRYLVGSRIARGGMASVYEATDTRLDRTVAVKVMHAGLADAHAVDGSSGDFAARFVREARAAARLSHPNVVAVHDQGEDDGVVFLAMELVPGHTLRDTISKESPMSPARALALMEPVVSALAAAHRAGLIHRDVKPENVLIADDGRVKVADFGLAKAISADTQHTATQGVLIGTVSYLAPELVIDGTADARADVYAVGVVLYELLTGKKPHEGETPIAVAYKHVHHDVPAPSSLVSGIPAYVDALVARATARDRSLRPADAGVLLHQLHRVSQALADGVRDDPELTQDLSPLLGSRGAVRPGAAPESHQSLGDIDFDYDIPTATTALPVRGVLDAPPPRPPTHPVAGVPRPQRPQRPRRPRRSRRGPVLLVLALLLALAVGGGAYYVGFARYTTTPTVLDLSRADAEQRLADAGLKVGYADAVYSRDVPKGAVASADPGSGARVLPGHTVTLTLSLGRDSVPKVRGLSEDAAQDRLLAQQLTFGKTVPRYSEKTPEGVVLTSSPKPGTVSDPGAVVDLVVSKGRRPLTVGSWVGKNVDQVTGAITKAGLVPDVTGDYSDTVAQGDVISQTPGPGSTLHKGDHVALVVSNGPQLVEVPSVRLQGVDAARQTLEDAGFKVTVTQNSTYYGLGFAVRTDPAAGSMAPKGSAIVLYVV